MKRFLIVSLTLGLLLQAADARAQSLRFGVKGGIASTTLVGEDVKDLGAKSLTGGIAGGFLTVQFGQFFALQPEVLWTRKGAQLTIEDEEVPGSAMEGDFRVDYIEIPLLAQAIFALPGDRVLPRIFAGPAVSFKNRCEAQVDDGGVEVKMDCDEVDADVTKTDWGAVMGLGTEIDLGALALVLDARASFGLNTIDDTANPDEIKNRSLSAMVGVSIPLGRRAPLAARL